MTNSTFPARVHSLRYEADGVVGVELRPADGQACFMPFEPGAHIDLHLPNGLVRSYSLTNPQEEACRYMVAVLNDRNSRGGSRFVHENLRVGTVLPISAPRNLFKLEEAAPHTVLLAGGIGITPVYAMFQRLAALGRPVDIIVCARNRQQAAFVSELEALSHTDRRVHLHLDDVAGGPPDLKTLLAPYGADAHFYCCGPQPMLNAFEQTCAELSRPNVHIERFAAAPVAAKGPEVHSYVVELRRSAKSFEVNDRKPLLDTLLEADVKVDFGCREGICGACETPVLEGEIDHRDSILTPAERLKNRSMMLCVSHCKSARLVLDL